MEVPRDGPGPTRGTDEADRTFILFRSVVDAIGDAVVVTSTELDPPGPRIEYVNPAFTRMTGYEPGDVLGQTPRLFQGPETDRAELDRLRACLTTGEPFEGEVINYRKGGQPYLMKWLVTSIADEHGQLLYWLSVQRDVTERKTLEHRQELLVAELHHRTRNLLTVVGAIATRTLPASPGRDTFQSRLAALSRVQTFLAGESAGSIALADLVFAELDAVGENGSDRLTMTGPPIELPGDKVQVIAMTLHELVTNAVKHGALSGTDGRLAISWSIESDGRLALEWCESGVARSGAGSTRGFGLELIERGLPYQLKAETHHALRPDGFECVIRLPPDVFRASPGDRST